MIDLRKTLTLFIFGIILTGGVLSFASPALAAEFRTRDTSISEDEYIDDDLFLLGGEVEMKGTVTGDLVATGDNVTVSGNVGGNLYASGGEVLISGEVGKSLYIAGGRVKVTANVDRNIYSAGGMILISSDAYVMEDLLVAGGQLDLDGMVGDDLWATGGNINISADVEDDLIASGAMVRADEEKVNGDYRVRSGEQGEWNWDTETEGAEDVAKSAFFVSTVLRVLWFFGLVLVGFLFIRFMPVKTVDIVDKIGSDAGDFMWSLAIGILVSAAVPLAIVVLVATVIGAPFAFLLVGLLIFLVTFGSLWADMAVGNRILDVFGFEDRMLYTSLIVGRVLRGLITLIPCIGALYGLVLGFVVIGAAVRMKMERMESSTKISIKGESSKRKKSRKK